MGAKESKSVGVTFTQYDTRGILVGISQTTLPGETPANSLPRHFAPTRDSRFIDKDMHFEGYLNEHLWDWDAFAGLKISDLAPDGRIRFRIRPVANSPESSGPLSEVRPGRPRASRRRAESRSSSSSGSVERALAAVDITELWEEESSAARIEQELRFGAREYQVAATRERARRAVAESSRSSGEATPPRSKEVKRVAAKKQADLTQFDRPAADGEKECSICMDNVVQVALVPCGHRLYCNGCAAKLKECSVCRAKIQTLLRTFEN